MFAALAHCVQYSDRAAGICDQIYPVTTISNKQVSPGVCVRGAGGPCTFTASSDGVSGSVSGDHSSADSLCSSWDSTFC
eukprot:764690-Hanusia_phi.AAC.10